MLLNDPVNYVALVTDEQMSMDHWWNDTEREKLKYYEINQIQFHSVYHKSHTDRTEIEPGPPHAEARNYQ